LAIDCYHNNHHYDNIHSPFDYGDAKMLKSEEYCCCTDLRHKSNFCKYE